MNNMKNYKKIEIGDYGNWPYYELLPRVLIRYDFSKKDHRKSIFLTEEQFEFILRAYIDKTKKELISETTKIFNENERLQEDKDKRSELEKEVKNYISKFPVAQFSNF